MALLPTTVEVKVKPSPELKDLLEDTVARVQALVEKVKAPAAPAPEQDLDDVVIHLRKDGKEWRVLVEVFHPKPATWGGTNQTLAGALGAAVAESLLLTEEVKK